MAVITISSTGGNWGATGTWVGGVLPATIDTVAAATGSGNLTLTDNRSIAGVDFTNYTATFTINSGTTLTCSGSFRLVAAMGVTGSGTLSLTTGGQTLTSAGKIWTGSINFNVGSSNLTFTLGDSWIVAGNLTATATAGTVNLNSNSIEVRGNFTIGTTTSSINFNGTSTVIIAPPVSTTSTISTSATAAAAVTLRTPLTLNGAGNIVFSFTGNTTGLGYNTGTFTYTAGTVTSSSSISVLTLGTPVPTLNLAGLDWQSIMIFTSTATYSISSSFSISGQLDFGSITTTVSPTLNGSTITCTGTIRLLSSVGGAILSGTTAIVLGSGANIQNFSTVAAGGRFGLDLTINAAGTVTFQTAGFIYGGSGRTFTYTTGTVSYAQGIAGTTWTAASASPTYTINGAGFSFPNFVTGLAPTFGGSQGCSFYSYTSSTAGLIHTFTASRSYTITNAVTLTGTNASRISFASSPAGTQATLTVSQGASIDIGYVNATDINSSQGQTIWSYRGTLSNATNWQQLPTQPRTVTLFNV